MKVYLNKITGYASAMSTLYQSKRTWTEKLEEELYRLECLVTSADGRVGRAVDSAEADFDYKLFMDNLKKVCEFGRRHITLLRFIDLEFTVEGIHRGAQDDFDAHAKRLDNRIVRASTRLSKFTNEKSDYYKDKILTTDEVLDKLELHLPERLIDNGVTYVRAVNGYVREDLKDNKDVLRGLYMLSIPSTFTAKCNLTEFAHIVKLRDKRSDAAPELREMIEELLRQIEDRCPLFTREFFYSIEN